MQSCQQSHVNQDCILSEFYKYIQNYFQIYNSISESQSVGSLSVITMQDNQRSFNAGDVVCTSKPYVHVLMHQERDVRCEECLRRLFYAFNDLPNNATYTVCECFERNVLNKFHLSLLFINL